MKCIILSIVLLISFACSKNSVEEAGQQQQSLSQNHAQQTPIPAKQKLNIGESAIYAVLLEEFAYTAPLPGNWIIVQKETIAPNNLEDVKSLSDLSPQMVNDFIEKNKSKEN